MSAVASILILVGLAVLVLGLIRPKLFHRSRFRPGRWMLAGISLLMLIAGVAVMPTPERRTQPAVEAKTESPPSSSAEAALTFDDAVGPAPTKSFFGLTVQQVADALAERKSGLARADGKPDLREFTQKLANDGSSVLTTKRGDLEASFDASGRLVDVLLISRSIEGNKLPWGITSPMRGDLAAVVPDWKAAGDWVYENQEAVWAGTEARASHSGLSIAFRRVDGPALAILIKPDTASGPSPAPLTMAERVEAFTDLDTYCRFAREDTEIAERAAREIGPNAAYGVEVGERITLETTTALKPTTRPGVEYPKVAETWMAPSYQLPSGSDMEIVERNRDGSDLHYLVRTTEGVLGFIDPLALVWIDKGERAKRHSEALPAFRDPLKADLGKRFTEETGLDFLAVELAKGMGAGWNAKCADR
ncbi:hypothetical protein [Thalassobaculum sp.]|uniref:hypothetical protein n=1 Tax=Thalassobaculum sp. TaxID=2022740 RepID=UPI0032F05108